MHFFKLISTLAVLAGLTAATPYVDQTFYKETFAPIQVERVEKYRGEHGDALTDAQNKALDRFLNLVGTQDYSEISPVRAATEAAFGKEEAAFILTGRYSDNVHDAVSAKARLRRAPACACATADAYCGSSNWCRYNADNCRFAARGCGTGWIYECNGLCRKK